MNQKIAKILKKYSIAKGTPEKQLKAEWKGKSRFEKDKFRQEMLTILKK